MTDSEPAPRLSPPTGARTDDLVVEWCSGSRRLTLHTGPHTRRLPAGSDHVLWSAGSCIGSAEGGLDAGSRWRSLFAARGAAAAARLVGPFAAALWDGSRACLVLLRDRPGTHGLYHASERGRVLFSPRLDALVRALPGPVRFDTTSLARHLHGIAPLPGATFVDGVCAVEPATVVLLSDRGTSCHRYWSLHPQAPLRLPGDADYADALRSVLDEVVPGYASGGRAGITLSGGLDSTTVAAVLRRSAPGTDLEGIAWRSPDIPDADESDRSALVAQHLDIPLVFVRADRSLPWSARAGAGPTASAAWRPYGLYAELLDATFAELARSGVEVAFTGVPGDPLFGNVINPLPDLFLTGRWRAMAREVAEQAALLGTPPQEILRRRLLGPVAHTYLRVWGRRCTPTPEPLPWLGSEHRGRWTEICRQPPPAPLRLLLPGRRDRFRDLVHPFQTHTLENLTRHAAAHGIELRHPLSDHRLVEFAARIPAEQSTRGGVDKHIVRNAMRGHLPDAIVDRPWKTVQLPLLRRALRCDARPVVQRLSTDMALAAAGVVDEGPFRRACADYVEGRTEDPTLCHTLAIEEWVREWA